MGKNAERGVLGLILLVAAALRAWLPFGHVFEAGVVNAQTSDAWYHLRIIDNLSVNFPHALHVDPYAAAGGQGVPAATLFDAAVALVARVLAVGAPSPRLLETVAAWMPVLLALATIAIAFAIGTRLFGATAGLIAAAFLATMPGPFLDRTLLGYVDHHAAEACLSALVFLGLLWVVDGAAARGRGATAVRSALVGVALGAYLLTWTSGAFLVFILAAWAGLTYVLQSAREPAAARPAAALLPALAVAGVLLVTIEDPRVPQHALRLASLGAAIAAVALLDAITEGWRRAGWPDAVFPAAAAAGAALLVAGASVLAPEAWRTAMAELSRLAPGRAAQTVGEVRSLVGAGGALRAWAEFRSAFFLAVLGLLALAGSVRRGRDPGRALLLVWTLVAFAATVAQNRFGYYLALESALLAGWLSARALRLFGAVGGPGRPRLAADAAVIGVALVVFYPSVGPSVAAARADLGMPPAWRHTLEWLRTDTPEPFADPGLYFARDRTPVPRPAYTVMNWWDHGYWLMRTARRVPVSNPTQLGATTAARFYLETDPAAAVRLLRQAGARYVTTGEEMPPRLVAGTSPAERWFLAMPLWAGVDSSRYVWVTYRRGEDGRFSRVQVFTPDYYASMMSRLYLFGGRAVTPRLSTSVITYRTEFPAAGGQRYDEITDARTFATYGEAQDYLASLGPGSYRIGGFDPARSAVPLPALDGFRVAYDSPEASAAFPGLPAVRVFELAPAAP